MSVAQVARERLLAHSPLGRVLLGVRLEFFHGAKLVIVVDVLREVVAQRLGDSSGVP
jgi:hypothetical protein